MEVVSSEAMQAVTDLHLPQTTSTLTVIQQSSLVLPTEAFEAQTQRGFITGLLGDVSGLELKRKVKRQLAAVSAALGYQRSDWECKEREVNPACQKTV